MPDILIRNLTDDQVTKLDSLAQLASKSRQEYLTSVIIDLVGDYDPQIILGYVELKGGELSIEDACPTCGQDFGGRGVWIGYRADLKPFGPVCWVCASD